MRSQSIESIIRLRQGVCDAIYGQAFLFDDSFCPLIVSMSGIFDYGTERRIDALQGYLLDAISAQPLVNFIKPTDLSVGFVFPDGGANIISKIQNVVRDERFKSLCRDLDIIRVEAGLLILAFPKRDTQRSQGFSAPTPSFG
jgi:hypothetical protein